MFKPFQYCTAITLIVVSVLINHALAENLDMINRYNQKMVNESHASTAKFEQTQQNLKQQYNQHLEYLQMIASSTVIPQQNTMQARTNNDSYQQPGQPETQYTTPATTPSSSSSSDNYTGMSDTQDDGGYTYGF